MTTTHTWLTRCLARCVFFGHYAVSYRAHTATALFLFAAFFIYDSTSQHQRRTGPWLFAVGAVLGYSSLIRYSDWVLLGAWIGVSLMRRGDTPY